MAFFSNLFKKTPSEPEQPKTRQDLENSLYIQDVEYLPMRIGTNALQQAFAVKKKREPIEAEKKLLSDVFDLIASVPEGKKLIDDVAAMGFTIHFDAFQGNLDGAMYGDQKHIMLSPRQHSSVAAVAATAFHEMTHAVQNEKSAGMLADGSRVNIADQYQFQRAAEAAAWTEEAKFAYQIKDKHPEVLYHVEKFPMYKAFAQEMEASGDFAKAGEKAFKSWYQYKHYQTAYEKQHTGNICSTLNNCIYQKDSTALRESFSSEDALKAVFISNDINKNISADFLRSPEAFSLSKETVNLLDQQVEKYTDTFRKAQKDTSYRQMYSYETKQKYQAQENTFTTGSIAPKTVRPKTSMMASLAKIKQEQTQQHLISSVQAKRER